MTVPSVPEIQIDSTESVLEWANTGRFLAREVLAAEGFTKDMIALLEDAPGRTCLLTKVKGNYRFLSAIEAGVQRPTDLPDKVLAAAEMFETCRWLDAHVSGTRKPIHLFVTAGARLIDARVRMLGENWRKADFKALQKQVSVAGVTAKKARAKERRERHESGARLMSARTASRYKSGK